MDSRQIDAIAKRFGGRQLTRRQALVGAAGALAGAHVVATTAAAGGPGRFIQSATAEAGAETDDPMDGDVLTALQRSRAWINYGPSSPFDFVGGEQPVTEEHLEDDLRFLYDVGFRGIVTNALTYGLEATPRVAKRIGFRHVITKLWWADDELLELEKRNVADAIDDIDAIVVGNETVHKAAYRGVPVEEAVMRLRVEIEGLQEAHGKPVTTGLHRDDWAMFPEIATEFGDFVFPNLQPWWALLRNNPEAAAQWVVEVYELMRATPGMPADRVMVMQEAAYPSHALPPESAPGATPENQKIFYERLIASGVPFVYGFSFDQLYAREGSPPGGFGGLWDDQRQPKPVVDILDLGSYA